MPLLNYLGQAGLFLACLYGSYWLFFRKDAFHQLNRVLLLLIMASTLALPLIPAPGLFSAVEPLYPSVVNWVSSQPSALVEPNLEPAGEMPKAQSPATATVMSGNSFQWWAALAYFTGLAIIAARLAFQLFLVLRLLKRGGWKREREGWLVSSDAFNTPFSFWNVIFLPSRYQDSPIREHILEHERVHRRQWHTADLLAAELFCALFWFHPAAWWLNRALRARLEHIADEAVLNAGASRKEYQYSLLHLAGGNTPFRLANQFNQSLIKTRIVMMNAKKSPAHHKLKYLGLLPLTLLLVLAFNDARAQTKETRPGKASVEVGLGKKSSGKATQVNPKGSGISESSGSSVSKAGSAAKEDVVVGLSSSSAAGAGSNTGAGLGQAAYESVFVAIGAEFPAERLPQMEKDLEEQGILLDIEELDYNSDKLITQLKLNVRTTDGKMHGNGFSYNDGKPIDEPVIFYVRRDGGNYGFGIFTGKLNDSVPAEVRSVIERMENGYFVGKIISE